MMADAFELRIDKKRLVQKIQRMPELAEREFRGVMMLWGDDWVRTMARGMTGGGKPRDGGPLVGRTGTLRNTLRRDVKGQALRSLRLHFIVGGAQAPYARIHEEGGTIRPKRRRALTIPLDDAKTASGALSGKALIRRKGKGYTTDYGDTFILNTRNGNAFIVAETGRNAFKFLYVLKKKVKIPPRLGARKTASLNGPRSSAIQRIFERAINRVLEA